jgi:prophage regulatory protein
MKQFYRRSALEDMLGISRSTIYRLMLDEEFPRPIKLGRRAVGWKSEDIDEWLLGQAEEP